MTADNRHYSEINAAFEKIITLDPWDVGAILGGVNYLLRSTAINAATRLLPDLPPEGSGLDYFTNWEKNMVRPEIEQRTAPILGLADKVSDYMQTYSTMEVSDNEKIMRLMTAPSRLPQRSNSEAEYQRRIKEGLKPKMTMEVFVDLDHMVALRRWALLTAKAEAAVQALDRVEPSDGDIPEWLHEAIHDKILMKLKDRWLHSETRRTNTRLSKEQRDLAEANQKLIEATMKELGGEVPVDEEEVEAKAAKGVDDWLKNAEALLAQNAK